MPFSRAIPFDLLCEIISFLPTVALKSCRHPDCIHDLGLSLHINVAVSTVNHDLGFEADKRLWHSCTIHISSRDIADLRGDLERPTRFLTSRTSRTQHIQDLRIYAWRFRDDPSSDPLLDNFWLALAHLKRLRHLTIFGAPSSQVVRDSLSRTLHHAVSPFLTHFSTDASGAALHAFWRTHPRITSLKFISPSDEDTFPNPLPMLSHVSLQHPSQIRVISGSPVNSICLYALAEQHVPMLMEHISTSISPLTRLALGIPIGVDIASILRLFVTQQKHLRFLRIEMPRVATQNLEILQSLDRLEHLELVQEFWIFDEEIEALFASDLPSSWRMVTCVTEWSAGRRENVYRRNEDSGMWVSQIKEVGWRPYVQ